MTAKQNKIPLKRWGVIIDLMVRPVVHPKDSRDVEKFTWAVLIPIIRKAALDSKVDLVAPGPHEAMLAGGIREMSSPETISFNIFQQVIFQEYNIPPEREWRAATDWLFQALERISSETIRLVSIEELIVRA